MPSLLDYFHNDFKALSLHWPIIISIQSADNRNGKIVGEENVDVEINIKHAMDSSVRLFTFYIHACSSVGDVIKTILDKIEDWKKYAESFRSDARFYNDIIVGKSTNVYSNRIYFYTETMPSLLELQQIDVYAKTKSYTITIRSINYLETKMATEKPHAFISHDSRDKELIAKPLAVGLNSRLCFVWYDEFSLKIGDSLRQSIEKGIREAKKCILILTNKYLNNPGWGKKEFDSIFTREMIMEERIILPIW